MNLALLSSSLAHQVRVWFRADRAGGGVPYVNTLMDIGAAKRVAAGAVTANVAIAAEARAVSIHARGGAIRYAVGTAEAIAASATTSHYLAQGERAEFMVSDPCWIAAIRGSDAGADGVLEITELL